MNIPLAKPDITEREIEAVTAVLRTPQLALGPKLKEFEYEMAQYIGVKYAIAVNSGTSALHLIIKALAISDGNEVITTPFSFISSANCILFENAKPIFVDIQPTTLNIDPARIEEQITVNTKAILAVDVFGQPADWDSLQEIAYRYGLKLIEDSAEALGAEYNSHESRVNGRGSRTIDQRNQDSLMWRKAGSFGDAAVFAFYPNKQITTGEGGIVVTNNKEIACLCRSLRNQGRKEGSTWLQHERLGYNYRLSDINCALGIAQLERIQEILDRREQVAKLYNQRLKDVEEIEIPYVSPNVKMSWFVYVIRLSERYTRIDRDRILQGLRKRGIGCGDYFQPIHLHPVYRQLGYREGDFTVTESIAARTIALPFHNNLTEGEIDYVVSGLKNIVK
jgi:perosamine synthetase